MHGCGKWGCGEVGLRRHGSVAPCSTWIGVPASAGSGVPGSMLLSRPACHRLKPGLPVISYPGSVFNVQQAAGLFPCSISVFSVCLDRSPGFSRIRRSRQYAPVPAGMPPAKAGTPGHFISGLCFQRSAGGRPVPMQHLGVLCLLGGYDNRSVSAMYAFRQQQKNALRAERGGCGETSPSPHPIPFSSAEHRKQETENTTPCSLRPGLVTCHSSHLTGCRQEGMTGKPEAAIVDVDAARVVEVVAERPADELLFAYP